MREDRIKKLSSPMSLFLDSLDEVYHMSKLGQFMALESLKQQVNSACLVAYMSADEDFYQQIYECVPADYARLFLSNLLDEMQNEVIHSC